MRLATKYQGRVQGIVLRYIQEEMIVLYDYIKKIGEDKMMHELGGFGIHCFLVAVATLFFGFVGYFVSNHIATALVYLVSVAKEVIDGKEADNTYDKKDIQYGVNGSLLALCVFDVILIIYLIIHVWL